MDELQELVLDEFLDEEKLHKLIFRVKVNSDRTIVHSFVILYAAKLNGKNHEIIKFDAKPGEGLHVHTYYSVPIERKLLHDPLNSETLEKLLYRVKQNWQWYYSQYKERYL